MCIFVAHRIWRLVHGCPHCGCQRCDCQRYGCRSVWLVQDCLLLQKQPYLWSFLVECFSEHLCEFASDERWHCFCIEKIHCTMDILVIRFEDSDCVFFWCVCCIGNVVQTFVDNVRIWCDFPQCVAQSNLTEIKKCENSKLKISL